MTRVLGREDVSVGGADGVVVLATVLAVVGAVLLAPWLGVERAVSSIGDVVNGEEVGVEEVASIVCAVRSGVAVVVGGVGSTSGGTLASVVDTREVLDAHVGVLALGIERSVGGTTELSGAVEAGLSIGWVVLGVAVRASNDNLELGAPLALVDSSFGGYAGAPESALYVGEACRVLAASSWVDRGVTLEVDVEGCAEVGGIAELLALDGVVGLQGGQTHVAVGIDGCLQVNEGLLVALRLWCVVGCVGEGLIGQESINGVHGWLGAVAIWLRSASCSLGKRLKLDNVISLRNASL